MENNVMIRIKTLQEADGESFDAIELETPGKFGEINHKYYIKYEESAMTGFPDTATTLKIRPGNLKVIRKGRYNMTLHYEAGCRNLCLYPTPYGEIGAQIYTSEVAFDFQKECGRLRVDYTLDADNENFIQNSLRVEIRPI